MSNTINTTATTASAIEEIEAYTIGERRTRTTRNGITRTATDVSILPQVRRYKLVPAASGMSKGNWNTTFAILVKVGDSAEWKHTARIATEYGMHAPNVYQSFEKAKAAAQKIAATWGIKKAARVKKETKSETIARLEKELAAERAKNAAQETLKTIAA